MKPAPRIVIVGAGPAGIRAAETLVAAGLAPLVIDEGARYGGQIYRQPPEHAGFTRGKEKLYGFETHKAAALHATMAALQPHLEYSPDTLVWGCAPGQLDTLHAGQHARAAFTHLLIAGGATDRVLPFPGWTLPGVYTLGAAQIALKAQGCAIGRRVILAGTGPLLYLVAYQYAQAGAQLAAVLDTSPFSRQIAATRQLLQQPATLAKGLYYVAWLKAHGIRVERGVTLMQALGKQRVSGLVWQRDGQARSIPCDAVGFGFGLRSETQLADLAGCRFVYSSAQRAWLPELDPAGRSSVAGIYLAGDGAGIAGADAAELSGRRAALALLEDLGRTVPRAETATLERRLARLSRFRAGLEDAFAPPAVADLNWPDTMTVCRCEEIDAGTLRRCIRSGQANEINRLKALTRVGMGRCQGRMCGTAAVELLAAETGRSPAEVGRLRGQAPLKPIPLSSAIDDASTHIPESDRDE